MKFEEKIRKVEASIRYYKNKFDSGSRWAYYEALRSYRFLQNKYGGLIKMNEKIKEELEEFDLTEPDGYFNIEYVKGISVIRKRYLKRENVVKVTKQLVDLSHHTALSSLDVEEDVNEEGKV